MRKKAISRSLVALELAIGLAGCASHTTVAATRTFVFVCDDRSQVVVRVTGAEAWVFRPAGTIRLPAAPGDGDFSDGSFVLSIEGERARLGEAGGDLRSCRNDRRRAVWEKSKLDGADFRAVGNEPGWSLEIFERRRLVLVTDNGESRTELTLGEPSADPQARTTRWEARDLILEVIGRPCRDSMSGEELESEVRLTWQGRSLRGCGRALH